MSPDPKEASVPVSALRALLARYHTERWITGIFVVERLQELCDQADAALAKAEQGREP